MRYQKNFVQNKVRVLGEALSRIGFSNQKHIINKKDGSYRVLKGKHTVGYHK